MQIKSEEPPTNEDLTPSTPLISLLVQTFKCSTLTTHQFMINLYEVLKILYN